MRNNINKYFSVIVFVLCFVILSDSCGSINSATVRNIASTFFEDTGNPVDFGEIAQSHLQVLQLGTKWCGAGNTADDYDDLGKERATDMCCREHDNCPDVITAGETRHNLTNEAFYTRLSCQCDEQFRQCLRAANSRTANNIGVVYFNALATKCFRVDYPALRCTRRGGWLNRKCLEHTYDASGQMLYQWFDVVNY